jgi:hypothetical protein
MDDLTRIKGIGKKTAEKLVSTGIDSFEKLARFGEFPDLADTVEVEAGWIEQARELDNAQSQQIGSQQQEAPSAEGGQGGQTTGDGELQPAPGDTEPVHGGGADGSGDGGGAAAPETLKTTNAPQSEAAEGGAGKRAGPAAAERSFRVTSNLLCDGREITPPAEVLCTRARFDELKAAGVIEGDWTD